MDFDLGGPIFPPGTSGAADLGDLAYEEAEPAQNRDRIRDTVRAIVERGAVPVVIGGDDSVPIPLFQAFAGHGPLTLVQIDAHIDWRDEVAGEQLGLSSTMRRASELAQIDRIIQIGQRGIGSARVGDFEDAQRYGVRFVPASALDAAGTGPAVEMVPKGRPVIINFDCDALDPAIMPADCADAGRALLLAGHPPAARGCRPRADRRLRARRVHAGTGYCRPRRPAGGTDPLQHARSDRPPERVKTGAREMNGG
jgi:agmatinase